MSGLIEDCRRAIRPWVRSPRHRSRIEALAIRRAIIPHADNNNFRKLTLLALFGVWAVITLGGPVSGKVNGLTYTVLTALIFSIIGRQWGLEVSGIAPDISISSDDAQDDDNSR